MILNNEYLFMQGFHSIWFKTENSFLILYIDKEKKYYSIEVDEREKKKGIHRVWLLILFILTSNRNV